MPQLVESSDAARGLADHVLDPGRERPIVCVSVPRRDSEPLVNVEEMEAAVGQVADVWVVRTGDATWELAHRLPVGLDVYDGAVRLWWPGLDEAADRFAHPLFFVYSASDSAAVIARVVAALEQGGSLRRAVTEPGSEHAATVTGITADGAELELADGTPAFAHRAHLSRHGLPPRQVVRVAQAVRVRVGDSDPARRRVPVSLLPFEPDPWGRLLADHPEGSLVEVVVRQLRNNGAIVEVLPELTGWVPKPEISHEYLQHPEDVLWVGHRVVARIERVDGEGRRVILSLLDVAADGPGRAAAIYPDGPGWLVPQVPAAAAQPDVVAAVVAEPETVAESSPADLPAPAQPVTTPAPSDEASPEQGELAADRLPAAAGEAEDESGQVDELEQVVAQAREIQREVRVLLDERDRQLARLRGEAAEIRRGLERDLAEVRQRILETLETESGQLIGSTQQALEDARRDAEDLRARLAAAEQDRQELVERLRESSRRADVAERTTAEIRERLRRERATTQQLHNQIQRLAPDEKTRLRDEIHTVWHQVTTPDDRQRYPWREPVVGVEFVDSLSRVQGVAHDRILRVCAEVVCRRAVDVPGMDVHPLRESLAGDAPQHVRADGAKAYRASLRPPEVGEPHVG